VAFLALRALNGYGDPRPGRAGGGGVHRALVPEHHKYPPSLLFLLMTLGPALLALRLVDARTPRLLRPGAGDRPGAVLLLPAARAAAAPAGRPRELARYGAAHWMVESPTVDRFPVTQPPGWPAPLSVVYLVWVLVVVLLYPCCRWYAALRARRGDAWLSYL
jgi:hypothetical protein